MLTLLAAVACPGTDDKPCAWAGDFDRTIPLSRRLSKEVIAQQILRSSCSPATTENAFGREATVSKQYLASRFIGQGLQICVGGSVETIEHCPHRVHGAVFALNRDGARAAGTVQIHFTSRGLPVGGIIAIAFGITLPPKISSARPCQVVRFSVSDVGGWSGVARKRIGGPDVDLTTSAVGSLPPVPACSRARRSAATRVLKRIG